MPETFEIRSKAFTIKWVDIPAHCKVEWRIRPLKNSINLGIYQRKDEMTDRNNNANGVPHSMELIENLSTNEVNQLPYRFFHTNDESRTSLDLPQSAKRPTSAISNSGCVGSSLEVKLEKHLKKYKWHGRCPSDTIQAGTIESENGGLYAFVFDNTFSKTKAKTVIFQYEIKPMNSSKVPSPKFLLNEQTIKFDMNSNRKSFKLNKMEKSTRVVNVNGIQYLEGFLVKRRRNNNKSGKHFNRRFFSLNLSYGILDYYSNDKSSVIRGNMMIIQAVVSADSTELMLYLDSGMEQWVLKALNEQDFNTWVNAFNYVKNEHKKLKEIQSKRVGSFSEILSDDDNDIFYDFESPRASPGLSDSDLDSSSGFLDEDYRPGRGGANPQFKIVAEKMKSLKELVQEMIKQGENQGMSPRLNPMGATQSKNVSTSSVNSRQRASTRGSESSSATSTMKRKPSLLNRLRKKGSMTSPTLVEKKTFDEARGNSTRNVSPIENGTSVSPTSSSTVLDSSSSLVSLSYSGNAKLTLDTLLEKIVELENEYENLTRQQNNNRSTSVKSHSRSTRAISIISQEFFDAQEYGDEAADGVVMIQTNESDSDSMFDMKNKEPIKVDLNKLSFIDESSDESLESDEIESTIEKGVLDDVVVDESKPTSNFIQDLAPLPFNGTFKPRSDVKPAASEPPSLISILRKGVGKDLSNMAMPITTNEPLSFLQTYAETLEYSNLLSDALSSKIETGERLLKIGAFAVSYLSSFKDKVRATRKPFNPLLGETFELVRPDMKFRLVAEKVIHKPFVMAAHVDSYDWIIDHNVCPTQKFYGKTAEIIMDGVLRLRFKNGEVYEWSQPTTTMRNVVSITGEKYTEPTEPITIKSNTGFKCVVDFISANTRFSSSRSERVELKAFDKGGKQLKLTASGAWTSEIKLSTGTTIWKINPELAGHSKKYGFTTFACSLNHMDAIHENSSPTDSRRRPDKKLYEEGDIDKADIVKKDLEERQRKRRKDASGKEVIHKPAFFTQGKGGNLDWTFKNNDTGYWDKRKRMDWNGVLELW